MNDRDKLINIAVQSARRAQIRWIVLDALNHCRPFPIGEPLILKVIQRMSVQCTALELRPELDYLLDHGLIELRRLEGAPWTAQLTRAGVNFVEYIEPRIARPTKWSPPTRKTRAGALVEAR